MSRNTSDTSSEALGGTGFSEDPAIPPGDAKPWLEDLSGVAKRGRPPCCPPGEELMRALDEQTSTSRSFCHCWGKGGGRRRQAKSPPAACCHG